MCGSFDCLSRGRQQDNHAILLLTAQSETYTWKALIRRLKAQQIGHVEV